MSGMAGTRVLVTGAGGFVGSHLVERLVRDGAQVRGFFRYTSTGTLGHLSDSPVCSDVEPFLGDVRDGPLVTRAVRDRDVVFHLAALIGIPYSYDAPASYVATNIDGTLNILNAARSIGARVVHTSTSEVYGTAQRVPIDESHPLNAQSPYAATKIGADMLALSFHRSFGDAVAVLRPFNVYGPRQSARAVIPTIVGQLLNGSEVRIGSLTPRRDLTFVTDTVEAFIRTAGTADAIGRVINVGTGRSTSIADLIAIVGKVVGRQPVIVGEPDRVRPATSEVEVLQADASLAAQLLGWRATVSLEDGLKDTADWIADHIDEYGQASRYVR